MSKINPSTSWSGFHPLIHTLRRLFCHSFHSFSSLLLAIFSTSTVIFTSEYRYYVMSPLSKKNFWLHNPLQLLLHFFAPICRNTHTHGVYIHYFVSSFPTLFHLSPNKLCFHYISENSLVKVTNCLPAAKSNGMFLVLDKILRFRYIWSLFPSSCVLYSLSKIPSYSFCSPLNEYFLVSFPGLPLHPNSK